MKRKRKEIHGSHLNPLSFFKILHFPSSLFKNLRIPNTAAKVLHNELSSEVFLRVPTGETRKVSLVKQGNGLWFCDGWREFMKHFSIGIDYFMVFKYEGNSTFTVHIFDLTACEINYQCNKRCISLHKPRYDGINVGDDKFDHHTSPEILHSTLISSKECNIEDDHRNINGIEKGNNEREFAPFGYPLWLRKYEELIAIVTTAGISLPTSPFFIAFIKPYNLKFLYIPSPFVREHIQCVVNQRKCICIKLQAHDGRQWEVDCARQSHQWIFSGGWRLFAKDIALHVGDICIFELTNSKKFVLKVHVVKRSHSTSQELHALS